MKRFLLFLSILLGLSMACGQYTATATPAAEKSTPIPTIAPTLLTESPPEATGTIYTPTPVNPPCAVVIALQSLNLRSLASEDSEADPQGLRRGDELEILRRVPGWLYVQVTDGRRGYVRAAYVVECEK
jgi:uncharacterized protein YgiM (DUF1202 family)